MGVGVGASLLGGVVFAGLAAYVAVWTALEDVADLRMGDKLVGWPGYVVAAVLAGTGAAGLVATRLGPHLWRRGEVASARWALGVPVALAARSHWASRRSTCRPDPASRVRECPVGVLPRAEVPGRRQGAGGSALSARWGVRERPVRGRAGCGPGRCRWACW